MSMKSKANIMALMAMALMSEGTAGGREFIEDNTTPEERKAIQERIKRENHKNNGLKEFRYGSNVVYAINKKNADKKAKKLNYI